MAKESWYRIYEELTPANIRGIDQFVIETKDYGYLALPEYNKLRSGKKPSYSVQVITDTFVPSEKGMKRYRSFKKHDGAFVKKLDDLPLSSVLKLLNTAIEVQDMCLLNGGVFKDANGKVISVTVKGNAMALQSYQMKTTKKQQKDGKKMYGQYKGMVGDVKQMGKQFSKNFKKLI
jgi:hypothetical protein